MEGTIAGEVASMENVIVFVELVVIVVDNKILGEVPVLLICILSLPEIITLASITNQVSTCVYRISSFICPGGLTCMVAQYPFLSWVNMQFQYLNNHFFTERIVKNDELYIITRFPSAYGLYSGVKSFSNQGA